MYIYLSFFLFCRCKLHVPIRKLLCFLFVGHKGNSPRFGLAIRELPFDFS